MRFLADENIAPTAIQQLREAGHDVLSVKEIMKGWSDKDILTRAVAESRIVVTFDKDFGELAFRSQLSATCGVILFRITPQGRDLDVQLILRNLLERTDWAGAFWTITEKGIRRRPLPDTRL